MLQQSSATQSTSPKVQILTPNGRFYFYWILCGLDSGGPTCFPSPKVQLLTPNGRFY